MKTLLTLDSFYTSALGQYVRAWEEVQYGKMVSDCFGYNALQLGVPSIDFLRNNRIGLKIVGSPDLTSFNLYPDDPRQQIALMYEALPFDTESMDLVLLPHTLEISDDYHALLREVSRMLIPGGRVIITGFNMTSLWGFRLFMQKFGKAPFLPGKQFFSVYQVRDWLHLLSFRVDRGVFGCYSHWGSRTGRSNDHWIEKAGDRWWPQCGALYSLGAVKQVQGYKLVGKIIKKKYFFLGNHAGVRSNKQARAAAGRPAE